MKIFPFLKWFGGKQRLLPSIRSYYPFDNINYYKYVEPFVGGGAVLFDILNTYKLKEIYISDRNPQLINCYLTIRDNVTTLIDMLTCLSSKYSHMSVQERKQFYYKQRDYFNSLIEHHVSEMSTEMAATMIFLNKTCFNGLYRVNSYGHFNSPAGTGKDTNLFDKDNLLQISKLLQDVNIAYADYKDSIKYIDEHTFVYLDPPYVPVSKTSNFTSYTSGGFSVVDTIEFIQYANYIDDAGARCLISNSTEFLQVSNSSLFEPLHNSYSVEYVTIRRNMASDMDKRHDVQEILLSNS